MVSRYFLKSIGLVVQHCDPPYRAIGYSYTYRIYRNGPDVCYCLQKAHPEPELRQSYHQCHMQVSIAHRYLILKMAVVPRLHVGLLCGGSLTFLASMPILVKNIRSGTSGEVWPNCSRSMVRKNWPSRTESRSLQIRPSSCTKPSLCHE